MSKLKRKHYEKLLAPMQLELARMAQWVQHEGKRVVVVFEGRDTAGKGGAIDAVREHLNPRQQGALLEVARSIRPKASRK